MALDCKFAKFKQCIFPLQSSKALTAWLTLEKEPFKTSYTSNPSQSFVYLEIRFHLKSVTLGGGGGGVAKMWKYVLLNTEQSYYLWTTEQILCFEDPSLTWFETDQSSSQEKHFYLLSCHVYYRSLTETEESSERRQGYTVSW